MSYGRSGIAGAAVFEKKDMGDIKVGIAQVDYTPQAGLPMMGNFRDDYAARGTHDPLCSRAMVFANDKGKKIAMLSMDICMLDRDNVSFMRKLIASKADIALENILIAATHTHSGPAPMELGSLPKCDDADIAQFLRKASTAVVHANKNLKAANLFAGYGNESRLSYNRRLKCKDGKTHMNWEGLDPEFVIEPLGPIDPQVMTISIEQHKKKAAAMVNFGLHPAVLAGDNWLYSADYPGYLAEAMRRFCGQEFITAFFNGCCGNVNHIDYTDKLQGRGYVMTQRIGYMLAVDVYQAMLNQTAIKGNTIEISRKMVPLKRLKITEGQRKWSQQVIDASKKNPAKGQVDGLPDEHYARTWLGMYEKQHEDDYVEVMAIRIGDLAIVGLPGEIFCEFGLEIKKKSPSKHTMVIELANDAIGYLPTKKAFSESGYEPSVGSTLYKKGSGETLVASALDELNRLFA